MNKLNTLSDNEYFAKISEIYEALLKRINNLTKNINECIVSKKKRKDFNLKYKGNYYYIAKLSFVHFNKKRLGANNVRRTCETHGCLNVNHLTTQQQLKLDFDNIWKRLLLKGEKDDKSGCLLLKDLYVRKNGYGDAVFNGKTEPIHIISYKVKMRIMTIPKFNVNNEQLCVRHLCDNKHCYEPSHLELGTLSQNSYDDRIKSNTLLEGSKNPNSTITEDIAKEIKLSNYPKNHELYKSKKQRAKELNVSLRIVKSIDLNESWSHIPDKDGVINRKKTRKRNNKNKIWTSEIFTLAKQKIELNHTKDEKTGCWNWNLSKNKKGYGMISINNTTSHAHIVSCEVKHGYKRPKNLVTRHLCDNPSCVNPDHLEFGTSSENSIDSVKSGKCKRYTSNEIIKEIRNTYKKDGLTRNERSKKYNLSKGALMKIENLKTFKYLK